MTITLSGERPQPRKETDRTASRRVVAAVGVAALICTTYNLGGRVAEMNQNEKEDLMVILPKSCITGDGQTTSLELVGQQDSHALMGNNASDPDTLTFACPEGTYLNGDTATSYTIVPQSETPDKTEPADTKITISNAGENPNITLRVTGDSKLSLEMPSIATATVK